MLIQIYITFNLVDTLVEVVRAATHEGVEVKELIKIGMKCTKNGNWFTFEIKCEHFKKNFWNLQTQKVKIVEMFWLYPGKM